MTRVGFPHSDILGSTLGWQLPEAYRSLPRPSSALDAKASTMRPLSLTKHYKKPKFFKIAQKNTLPKGQRIQLMLATTIQFSNTTPHHQDGGTTPCTSWVLPQDPIVCLAYFLMLSCTRPSPTTDENPSRLTLHQLECFSWCSLERR